ncbi:hypothetical protein IBX65_08650 [Candidatus Aerophobetes bacterium]|nr:hypothetical protein [Candidatus Aerophobetes bacterium]
MNKLIFIEDIHKIRKDLYEDTKKMNLTNEAAFYNKQAEKLLKDWGIKLKKKLIIYLKLLDSERGKKDLSKLDSMTKERIRQALEKCARTL